MKVYFYVLFSALLGLPAFYPIERHIEDRIKNETAGVDEARVRIFASRLGFLFLGRCRKVTIEIRGLSVGTLRTALFRVEVAALRFRPFSTFVLDKARVRGAGKTSWMIRLLDEDLEKFIRRRSPVVNKVQVRIDEECVTLHHPAGLASLFSLKETFTLKGRFQLSEKKDVLLKLDHISAFGFSPGKTITSTIMSVVNPIVQAKSISRLLAKNRIEVLEDNYPFTTLEDFVLSTGHVEIHGCVTLKKIKPKPPEQEVVTDTAIEESTSKQNDPINSDESNQV